MLNELKSIISSWTSINSVWNDKRSQSVEAEVIFPLENAIGELEEQLENIKILNQNVENEIENIERTGEMYGWQCSCGP